MQDEGYGDIRSGGDFGLSAKYIDDNTIKGRLAGKSGGSVSVTAPSGFNMSNKEVHVIYSENVGSNNVQIVTPSVNGNTFTFNVSLEQKHGYVKYSIVPVGTTPDDPPFDPVPDTVAPEEPDLIVADISWSPLSPQTGDTVSFEATIKNQGGVSTQAGVVNELWLEIDGSTLYASDCNALGSGSSRTIQFADTWASTP